MLGRLFRRKAGSQPKSTPPAKPPLRQRIAAFLLSVWNGLIALAAVAGAVFAGRVSIGLWQVAGDPAAQPVDRAYSAAMMALALAAVVFLLWQAWRGVQYIRHRPR